MALLCGSPAWAQSEPGAAIAPPGAAPAPAAASTPAELVARLATADFTEKLDIALALATSGDRRSALILQALSDGNLFVSPDGKVFVGPHDGVTGFADALSGAPAAGVTEAGLEKLTVNNRLRRELRGLTGRLTLMSPDADVRRASADSALSAHDPESLAAVEAALAAERDAGLREKLQQARAAILLHDESVAEPERVAAVATLRARGDQDALNTLLGAPHTSVPVKAAIDAAVASIRTTLTYWGALQNIYYGVSLGSVLLLAAIGLAITFGVKGVINMAHGEMIMIGAYATFVVQQLVGASAPALLGYSLLLAVPVAFVVAGLAGIAVERSIIRFLYGRPLETLLATWGLSLILQQAVRTIFGPSNQEVTTPAWMSGAFKLGLLTVTYSRLWIIIFALTVLALLALMLRYTRFGMQMRAVTQNRQMASAMGIKTARVDALTFGLGSGIAGIAGVALSQIDNVSPNLGQSYIVDSFMVVVFGGVGNLMGTLLGAMTLGIANKFLEPYAGAVLGKILVLAFIILFIQRRPRGLFALKGRAVEA